MTVSVYEHSNCKSIQLDAIQKVVFLPWLKTRMLGIFLDVKSKIMQILSQKYQIPELDKSITSPSYTSQFYR